MQKGKTLLRFNTSKGHFLLVNSIEGASARVAKAFDGYEMIGRLEAISHFANVVDSYSFGTEEFSDDGYRNYMSSEELYNLSSTKSFESLIQSLGYYLWENPLKRPVINVPLPYKEYNKLVAKFNQEEEKVFRNPVLLKKKSQALNFL